MNFEAKRIRHEWVQTNWAAPQRVFPLLCPVRETEWIPGWRYRMIYSSSGVAELGCIFITTNEDGSETTWIVTEYSAVNFRIAFAWVNPGRVAAEIRIHLEPKGLQETAVHIQYTYTGLTEPGNREVERFNAAWFAHKMQTWEAAINHYLKTGRQIDASRAE